MTTLFAILPTMGPVEMLVVAVVAVLLFGSKLPDVARGLGRQMGDFKRGLRGVEEEFRAAANGANSSSATTARSVAAPRKHDPVDDRDELTAPKFQPPQSAPRDTATVSGSTSESAD